MPAIDPDLELQGLIINTLKTDPDVNALVAGRVFDSIPQAALFPYISYGPSDATSDDAECFKHFSVFVQLDVWSRAPGFPEAKRISDAVRAALSNEALVLATNALVFLEHRQTRNLRDPDGLTSHAALSFEASVERHVP